MAPAPKKPHRYVVVEGVIGVGKTTLVQRLAQRLRGRMVFEEFEENPFLPDFYKDREAFAFSTQIFFLMSRFRQQELLAQGDLFHAHTLSDYMFDKDRLFAILTLASHERRLYERLFDVLRVQVPRPDLVIYLRADLPVVLQRIAARGRSYEANMDPEYMRQLAQAYDRHFAERGPLGDDAERPPVITLDTSRVDLRADEAMVDTLVEVIRTGASSLPTSDAAVGDTLPLPGLR